MQGAGYGTRSQESGITSWAKARCSNDDQPPGIPEPASLDKEHLRLNLNKKDHCRRGFWRKQLGNFFKVFIYVFLRDSQRETQRQRCRDTGGERSGIHAGSPLWDWIPGPPGITPWAKGRGSTTETPRRPGSGFFWKGIVCMLRTDWDWEKWALLVHWYSIKTRLLSLLKWRDFLALVV